MHRVYLTLLLLLLVSFPSFGQSTITLKGKIIDDSTKLPLESATVYLTSAKDSTIIDYTISDKNGFFSLATKKITKPAFLKVSFMGYQDYKQEIKELTVSKDFGQIFIQEQPNQLGEVVIKGEAPPVRIKKDTLEFNAASFKIRPDANVEALLKQLPGVEITTDGKITVNGKEVNNILVNGKPFFGK
ncbi:MAG: TonB-dependent receptor, partial [Flavobacterium sp.]